MASTTKPLGPFLHIYHKHSNPHASSTRRQEKLKEARQRLLADGVAERERARAEPSPTRDFAEVTWEEEPVACDV